MKEHQHKKMKKMVSLKHLLVISLALNLGLISKVYFEGEKRVQQFYCFNEKHVVQEGPILEDREKKMTIKNKSLDTTSSSATMSSSRSSSSSSTVTHDSAGTAVAPASSAVIDLDHGDPTMYGRYWQQMGDKTTVVLSGWQSISYFSDVKNLCWFLEPEFANAVVRLHKLVGNAVTEGYHIVVGTGSTQLFQAVLYALCHANANEPISVVSAAPFYSSYPLITNFLKSGLYEWGGDARKFSKEKPYIELVTSPNNPDGSWRQPVVNGSQGVLIHDLAYYWPQYSPISFAANHDIMLFTVSKSTGHAGSRIGWALVKDKQIAKKMTKFIEISTIGVSKDSQLRSAKILHAVADSIEEEEDDDDSRESKNNLFEFGYNLLQKRWNQLRDAVNKSKLFSLPRFSSGTCSFSGRSFQPQPAFAWLKCENGIGMDDCEGFLRKNKILTRGGIHFGVGSEYVRISMLDTDEKFHLFTERLSNIKN